MVRQGRIRKEIDEVDHEIARLLTLRARYAREMGAYKRKEGVAQYDPAREKVVIARAQKLCPGLPPSAVRAIFGEIISACLSLEEPILVGYLGPETSFSDVACRMLFGQSVHGVPLANFGMIFDAVEKGECQYGVVPVENCTEGPVNQVLDRLIQTNLRVCNRLILPVSQTCMANCEPKQIKRVYSHPQALVQCRHWIATHMPHAKLYPTDSTAAGALMALKYKNACAIGTTRAAQVHGFSTVIEGVNDENGNATRFLVIGNHAAQPTGNDVASLILYIQNKPQALVKVLRSLKQNMTSIQSRPVKGHPWEYVFCIDVAGQHNDPDFQETLVRLEKVCVRVKVLGSYPA